MSRIGKRPITLPESIRVAIDGHTITVSDGKRSLSRSIHPMITVEQKDQAIFVSRHDDDKMSRALHGLTRTLINNMVVGLTEGFQKTLEINGIGYRAQMQGSNLVMNIGYSHPVTFAAPEGITIEVPAPTKIVVKGYDKERVGEVAAKIRAKRIPDPYHGKGIKYDYEVLKLKEGKSGAK